MPPGIFTDPFIEGLIVILLGVGTIVAGTFIKSAELMDVGKTLIGVGLGYFTHAAVTKPVEPVQSTMTIKGA